MIKPLVAMILIASPAEAHCYATWKYPWPQHCGVSPPVRAAVARVAAREEMPTPAPLPVGLREQPDIPAPPLLTAPTLNPPPDEWNEQMLHAVGIEELKKKMRQ